MCRFTKMLLYFLAFCVCLSIFVFIYWIILEQFRMDAEQPSILKPPSLTVAPLGRNVGLKKLIMWGEIGEQSSNRLQNQIRRLVGKYGYRAEHRLRECSLDHAYGYLSNNPCVLLKLNQALNFEASTYHERRSLPDAVPTALRYYLMEMAPERRANKIWASCDFVYKTAVTTMSFVPEMFYDADGLFTKENFYVDPNTPENETERVIHEEPGYRRIIGVKFHNLPPNKDVHVTCSVWARNIPLDYATVRFVVHRVDPKAHIDPLDILYDEIDLYDE
ncbi:uncharacterized protein LOC111070193 [Drosophila obscura]|uniref:uncharacterized protein LOC111070193 n=1 Tax=Drosophila obscura TaxID=7282 RepID=UPI000BA01AE1|nr:uncharacterized protein LOC111070193 [Drosophila obscura]